MKASTVWKLLGLAGVVGVAATGAIIARERRQRPDLSLTEVSERLHERLDEARSREAATR